MILAFTLMPFLGMTQNAKLDTIPIVDYGNVEINGVLPKEYRFERGLFQHGKYSVIIKVTIVFSVSHDSIVVSRYGSLLNVQVIAIKEWHGYHGDLIYLDFGNRKCMDEDERGVVVDIDKVTRYYRSKMSQMRYILARGANELSRSNAVIFTYYYSERQSPINILKANRLHK